MFIGVEALQGLHHLFSMCWTFPIREQLDIGEEKQVISFPKEKVIIMIMEKVSQLIALFCVRHSFPP